MRMLTRTPFVAALISLALLAAPMAIADEPVKKDDDTKKVEKTERVMILEHPDAPGPMKIRVRSVKDQPGVIAGVATAFRDEQVSIESMLQRGRSPTEAVPVVLTTHETEEAAMRRALAQIERLDAVVEPPIMIRIEAL